MKIISPINTPFFSCQKSLIAQLVAFSLLMPIISRANRPGALGQGDLPKEVEQALKMGKVYQPPSWLFSEGAPRAFAWRLLEMMRETPQRWKETLEAGVGTVLANVGPYHPRTREIFAEIIALTAAEWPAATGRVAGRIVVATPEELDPSLGCAIAEIFSEKSSKLPDGKEALVSVFNDFYREVLHLYPATIACLDDAALKRELFVDRSCEKRARAIFERLNLVSRRVLPPNPEQSSILATGIYFDLDGSGNANISEKQYAALGPITSPALGPVRSELERYSRLLPPASSQISTPYGILRRPDFSKNKVPIPLVEEEKLVRRRKSNVGETDLGQVTYMIGISDPYSRNTFGGMDEDPFRSVLRYSLRTPAPPESSDLMSPPMPELPTGETPTEEDEAPEYVPPTSTTPPLLAPIEPFPAS